MTTQFFQAISTAPTPTPADRSARGTLPARALQFCESARAASSFGHHFYPPLPIAFWWDGRNTVEVKLGEEHIGRLEPGESIQEPRYGEEWNAGAPESLRGCLYPLVNGSWVQPNMLQVWTGWLAQTDRDWGLLLRPPVNLPPDYGFTLNEGYVETDRWFGPLFANITLTVTRTWVQLAPARPLMQVQPIPRAAFRQTTALVPWGAWPDDVWPRYHETVVAPNRDPDRRAGAYAIRTRQRPAPVWPALGQPDESCERELRDG